MAALLAFLVFILIVMVVAFVAIIASTSGHHTVRAHEHQHQADLTLGETVKDKIPLTERVALARLALALADIGFSLAIHVPAVLHEQIHDLRVKVMPIAEQFDGWANNHSVFHLRDLTPVQLANTYNALADNPEFLAAIAQASHALDTCLMFCYGESVPEDHKIPERDRVSYETIDYLKGLTSPELQHEH